MLILMHTLPLACNKKKKIIITLLVNFEVRNFKIFPSPSIYKVQYRKEKKYSPQWNALGYLYKQRSMLFNGCVYQK